MRNDEAEQAVLGAVLLSPKVLRDLPDLAVDDFGKPAHGEVFRAMTMLDSRMQPTDPVSVADELERRGTLTRCGGHPYLLTLMGNTPAVTSAGYYARLVADKAAARRLREAGVRITQLAESMGDEPTETVDRARAEVDAVAAPTRGSDTFELDELLTRSLASMDTPLTPAFPTGFAELDEKLSGGLHPGSLVVMGARPGVGKSLLAVQMAANAAMLGHGALVVSLEMPADEVMERFLSSQSSVPYARMRSRSLTSVERKDLQAVADETRSWPLAVTDASTIGLGGIKSRARDRCHTPRGLSVLIVDYLQLVNPRDRAMSRHEQVGELSRGLKLIARDLGVCVVAAAQLNRSPVGRANPKPTMSDLRESGSIEADADVVLLLNQDEDTPHELEMIVGKQRGGPTGSVTLAWQPQFARARSLAR